MLLAPSRALRGAQVTPSVTAVVRYPRQGMKLSILPGTASDGHAMCRPTPLREASRHAVSYTGTDAYLHAVTEMFLQGIHAVAASATWWTDVPSETPNNISFITSFGASPRACICWYRCEPQWTAEAQYPASKPCPSYVDFSPFSSRTWPWTSCHMFVSTNNILTLARPRDSALRPRTHEMGLDLQPLDSWEF